MNDELEKKKFNKKKNILILGILFTLIIVIGATYAFFTYSRSVDAFTLTSGKISAMFQAGTNAVSFDGAYPISDSFAIQNLDKLTYIDFTVSGTALNENEGIEYEIYLTSDTNNTLDSKYLKVYLTDENNKKIIDPKPYSSLKNTTYQKDSNGKVVYTGKGTGEFSQIYRLYVWLDSSYEQNEVSQSFKFYVNLYAHNAKIQFVSNSIKESIEKSTCNPIVEEDGITYISGSKDCIDFNYVWYSGKLWRITAIYPDGTMKMITDDVITTINYGPDVNFYTDENNKSYMYQWLNEDFLDTLVNSENIIVTDARWNATNSNASSMSAISTKLPETTMVTAPVGLLNSYEYYMSYKNTTNANGYLNIGYYWWLLNPYSTSSVWYVIGSGYGNDYSPTTAYGGRPSVYLKSSIQLKSGTGTKTDPYRIEGDKEEPIVNTTLLNTRSSGEYVKFNNELYRIVSVENGITKLNKNDYVRDESNAVLTKKYSNNTTWGSGTTTDDYWDYYLNNTWKDGLSETSKSMLEEGTYYLGQVSSSSSYKNALCKTASNTVTTKGCEKTTSIWQGYVGLPRYGEMFASQQGSGYSSSSGMWLMNPYSSSSVWDVYYSGFSNGPTNLSGGRPSIHLKSGIKITGGDGTKENPFEITD